MPDGARAENGERQDHRPLMLSRGLLPRLTADGTNYADAIAGIMTREKPMKDHTRTGATAGAFMECARDPRVSLRRIDTAGGLEEGFVWKTIDWRVFRVA